MCVGVGGVCVCVCVCLAYTSEDFHMKTHRYTEDSTPSEDPKTGPRKTLAKNAKNVMFYHLRGVRAPRTSTDFQPYLIYEDIRVLGSISKASGGVCVCLVLLFLFVCLFFFCFVLFFVLFFFFLLFLFLFFVCLFCCCCCCCCCSAYAGDVLLSKLHQHSYWTIMQWRI